MKICIEIDIDDDRISSLDDINDMITLIKNEIDAGRWSWYHKDNQLVNDFLKPNSDIIL